MPTTFDELLVANTYHIASCGVYGAFCAIKLKITVRLRVANLPIDKFVFINCVCW